MREVRRGDDVHDDGGVLVREAAAHRDAARGDGVFVSKVPGGRDRGAGGEREGPGLKPRLSGTLFREAEALRFHL